MLKRTDKVLLATPYLLVVNNHFLCINSTCELLKVTDWAVQTLNKYISTTCPFRLNRSGNAVCCALTLNAGLKLLVEICIGRSDKYELAVRQI